MTKRLKIICSEIDFSNVFADVGCDHGFVSRYVLQNNLCNFCIVSDISKNSLNKAEELLQKYIINNKCKAYLSDGLKNFEELVDFCLIAGMGGKEILNILNSAVLPQKLLLQPMKNAYEVRKFLIENGYKILKDYTFFDGKYYDLIKAEKGDSILTELTENDLKYGKDNLINKSKDFLDKLKKDEKTFVKILKKDFNNNVRQEIERELKTLQEILYGN